LAELLRARGLVDADRPERAVALLHDVGPDPADVLGHLLVADLEGLGRRRLDLVGRHPAALPTNCIELHVCLQSVVELSTTGRAETIRTVVLSCQATWPRQPKDGSARTASAAARRFCGRLRT